MRVRVSERKRLENRIGNGVGTLDVCGMALNHVSLSLTRVPLVPVSTNDLLNMTTAVAQQMHQIKNGLLGDPIRQFDLWVLENQEKGAFWNGKGEVFHAMGQFDKALSCYEKAVEVKARGDDKPQLLPRHEMLKKQREDNIRKLLIQLADSFTTQGRVHVARQMNNEALEFFELATNVFPDFAQASAEKAVALSNLNRGAEAELAVQQALTHDPLLLRGFEVAEVLKGARKMEMYFDTPVSAFQWSRLGQQFSSYKQFEHAKTCFKMAHQTNPGDSRYLQEWGTTCQGQKEYQQAVDCFAKAVELNATNIDIWISKGECHRHLNEPENARECFNQAIQLAEKGNMIRELLKLAPLQASTCADLGQAQTVLSCCHYLIEHQPNAKTYRFAANTLCKVGLFGDAVQYVQNFVETLQKQQEEGKSNGKDDLDEFSKLLKKLQKQDKEAFEASDAGQAVKLSNFAWDLLDKEEYDRALELFDSAIERDQRNAHHWYRKSVALHHLGKSEESSKMLEEGIKMELELSVELDQESSCPDLFETAADLMYHKRDFQAAIMFYDVAHQMDNTDLLPLINKCIALRNLKRHEDALKVFEEVIELTGHNPKFILDTANSVADLGEIELAISFFDTAIELDGEDPVIWECKGYALLSFEMFAEAIEAFEQAIRFGAKEPEIWFLKGTACEKLGRFVDAKQAFECVLQLQPDHPKAFVALTMLESSSNESSDTKTSKKKNKKKKKKKNQNKNQNKSVPTEADIEKDNDPISLYATGQDLMDQKHYELAVKCFDKMIDLNADNGSVWSARTIALKQLNRIDDALQSCTEALTIDPELDDMTALLHELESIKKTMEVEKEKSSSEFAADFYGAGSSSGSSSSSSSSSGSSSGSTSTTKTMYSKDPKDMSAMDWNQSAKVLLEAQQFSDALQCANMAIQHDGTNLSMWYHKATALFYINRVAEAITACQQALDISPEYKAALKLMEQLTAKPGSSSSDKQSAGNRSHVPANNNAQSNMQGDSQKSQSLYLKASALMSEGKKDEALEISKQMIDLDKRNAMFWHFQAVVLKDLGRFDDAIESCTQALTIDPFMAEAGDLQQESESLKKAKEAEEAEVVGLGSSSGSSGSASNASDQTNNVPANQWSQTASVLIQNGQFTEALECIGMAIKMDGNNASFWFTKANVHKHRGDVDEAIAACKRALQISPLYQEAIDLLRQLQPSNAGNSSAKGKASVQGSKGKGKATVQDSKGKGKASVQGSKGKGKATVQDSKGKGKATVQDSKGKGKGTVQDSKGKGKGKVSANQAMDRWLPNDDQLQVLQEIERISANVPNDDDIAGAVNMEVEDIAKFLRERLERCTEPFVTEVAVRAKKKKRVEIELDDSDDAREINLVLLRTLKELIPELEIEGDIHDDGCINFDTELEIPFALLHEGVVRSFHGLFNTMHVNMLHNKIQMLQSG
eukprot:TRINITY_DN182_c0_g1_i1.p1 TRINITY_DN182_c0_g1~~TRINITY_DN182_c0_g1_i1.p1  ORF type:complete len:1443 (+),score=471.69 TRINITY_DN182_c0_g1_i1:1462-5790(+)